jgi:hypothetical protein
VVVGEADSFIDAPSVIKYLKQALRPRIFVDNADVLEQDGAGGNTLLPDVFAIEGADHGGWAASHQVGDVIAWMLNLPELKQASHTDHGSIAPTAG